MENNKELVEETTENVEEQTTEEIVEGNNTTEEGNAVEDVELTDTVDNQDEKLYSEKELNDKLNDLLAKKIAKREAKIRREYEEKYGRAENVIKAGLETDNFDEAVNDLENFWKEKGIDIPKYTSDFDTKAIANARADEVIDEGYEAIVDLTNSLAKKIEEGTATPIEKIEFQKVATERKRIEGEKELESIGVKMSDLDENFKSFEKNLNPELSLKEKYEMYLKFNPKPRVKPIGSMKTNTKDDSKIKEFYSYEEAVKFSKKDLDNNPELMKAIEKSMTKW